MLNVAPVPEQHQVGLDEQIIHLLRRAHQRASAMFVSETGDEQITPAQFFALSRLAEFGPLSQNRLGRLAAMDPATIQGVIRRLAERGMIERTNDPTDRRRMVVRLTPKGEALLGRLKWAAASVNAAVLRPLSQAERDQFVSLLKRLV